MSVDPHADPPPDEAGIQELHEVLQAVTELDDDATVRDILLPGRTCAHCQAPMRGWAGLNEHHLCHPNDGLDCYRLVTVYGHPFPCGECAHHRWVEDLIRADPEAAIEELRRLGYHVRRQPGSP